MATVHQDNMTIGGERSVVELLIKMISRKYEIKKQVIGEDTDLETSESILNRVIECVVTASQQWRIRDTSGRYRRIFYWNERITLRLHAP